MRTGALMLAGCLTTAVLSAGGCSEASRPVWVSFDPDDWSNRGETDDPVEFVIPGPVAIDVETFRGDVIISANPKHEATTVTVVREAIHGMKREKEGKGSLSDINVAIQEAAADLGRAVEVRITSANAEAHLQRAHVYIESPSIDGIKVHTASGRVFAKGIEGAVDVSTTDGEVRILTNRAMIRPVTILNQQGDINYRVRGESAGAFDCQSVDGTVTHRVRYGKLRVYSGTDDDTFLGTLNNGTNPVILRTVDGDIRVAVIDAPEQVGHDIVE